MISIFVCDDDSSYLKKLTAFIEEHIDIENYLMELKLSTSEPDQIIAAIQENEIMGLYFLDVELQANSNGIELARAIRKYDPRGFIVFITSHPQYMQTTFEYQVEALAYIQKTHVFDNVGDKIIKCIKNVHEKYMDRAYKERFIFKSINDRKISCNYADILFFETDLLKDKQVILHSKNRQYILRETINGVVKKLKSGRFFKCSQSSIVNLDFVDASCIEELSQNKKYITMPDGTECLVSARKRRELIRRSEL